MRGAALPAALLAASLGFILAYAPPKAKMMASVIFCVTAPVVAMATINPAGIEIVFLTCWSLVILNSLLVHLPSGIGSRIAVLLAAFSGVSAGGIVSVAGSLNDLLIALPCLAIVLIASWLVATKRGIAVKIGASWLIAIALLSAALPLTPTPGYVGDHME